MKHHAVLLATNLMRIQTPQLVIQSLEFAEIVAILLFIVITRINVSL